MKRSWISSVFQYTCPRCRQCKMFAEPFKLRDPLRMHERCQNCGKRFEPEPGFYFGAMFLSYIISAWVLLVLALTLVFYFGWTVEMTMLVVILVGILGYFKLLRLSRSLYIHIVVKYEGEKPPDLRGPAKIVD
ncbi:MAG: DUF983 domain-containing protein [Saprospiraceae bacterium]|nr:DUF983 domain-containing protein [Saprospiraceae bacterium]